MSTDELIPNQEWSWLAAVGTIPPELAAALVAAWAELSNIERTRTAKIEHRDGGGSHGYSYANLGDLLDVVRPVLSKHGLAMLQPIIRDGLGAVSIETWLLHSSGHLLRWRFEIGATGSPQAMGSSITYGRRYCAQASLGLATDKDDDGQAARDQPAPPPRAPRPIRVDKGETSAEAKRRAKAMVLAGRLGVGDDRPARLAMWSAIVGRQLDSYNDATPVEQDLIINEMSLQLEAEQDAEARRAAQDRADDADGYPGGGAT